VIERRRTVHDKVGASALFGVGKLLGDHVTACGPARDFKGRTSANRSDQCTYRQVL